MDAILPDREFAQKMGWLFQVQWIERGNQCFTRCKSGDAADRIASTLRKEGVQAEVFDLRDLLQIH